MGGENFIRIKLKVAGVEMEIECRPEDVEEAVRRALSGIKGVSGFKEITSKTKPKVKPGTCKELIENLWREGWFSEARTLGEVWDEMARRGYHYDRSAVAHALLDLTREGKITREGKARKYRYIQKIPYVLEKTV